MHELEVRMVEPVLDVALATGEVIIKRYYFVALLQCGF